MMAARQVAITKAEFSTSTTTTTPVKTGERGTTTTPIERAVATTKATAHGCNLPEFFDMKEKVTESLNVSFGVVFICGGNLCVCLKSILNFFAASIYL